MPSLTRLHEHRPSPPENLSGLIERVTFFNEENGFSVLKVSVKGYREPVCVVGSLPSANPGEWLTAEGRWLRDKQFGLQFKADLLKCSAPTSREGIEKYLGSGMVKGIGPVYARKLVSRFGEQIFHIIENESGRLEDVGGIGPTRRALIKSAWAEQKVIREIMVFLHSNGVSTSRAVRIYKLYGENAIEQVRANPYRLAVDVPGIGFKSADLIAQKIGIPRNSVMRACAGLQHVLFEASSQGHCALPLTLLTEEAAKLLQIEESIIDSAVERTVADGELTLETLEGERFAFLPGLKLAEEAIARRIAQLRSEPPDYPPIQLDKAIEWCQQKTGKILAPSQREALRQALQSRILIITGGPGVGKTTLVNALMRILLAKRVKCLLCAPTGRAARRLAETTGLEAKTIHRMLEVRPGGAGFARRENNPLECDVLLVDETSMVDVSLMHHLLRALPRRASLLLVGDVDQLPSVGPGMVLRDLIESASVPVVRLTEVFRQAKGSHIVTNAHRINEGLMPEFAQGEGTADFYLVERDESEKALATLLEIVKSRIPAKFGMNPIREVQVLSPMHRGSLGVTELNKRLQELLNPPRADEPFVEKFGSVYRIRDKVIQTENDYDKDVFNGDIGIITSIDGEEREVKVRFDTREVIYDYGELDELALAYAITVHKAQGSEFPAVIMPVTTQHYMMLQRNLLYTGVTRGQKLVMVVGQAKAIGIAVRNNQMQKRYSGLLVRLKAAQ